MYAGVLWPGLCAIKDFQVLNRIVTNYVHEFSCQFSKSETQLHV